MTTIIECTNSDCAYNNKNQCTRQTIRLLFFLSSNERIICDGEVTKEFSQKEN